MWRVSYAEFAARLVLVAAICALSWAFGGVEPVAKVWFAQAIGLATVLVLFTKASVSLESRSLPAIWIVFLLAIGLGFFQLADLDAKFVEQVSPNSVQVRAELGVEANGASSISVSQPETRRDLSLLILAVASACLASQVFQTVGSQLFLCFSVALNGAALCVWGLVQQLGNRNDLLPGIPCNVNSIIFSTYVNHSSAAGFLNMCLGASIGLLLWRYRSTHAGSLGNGWAAVRNFLRGLTPVLLVLFALTTLLIAGLGASLSRGGCLSALLAFVSTALVVSRRKKTSAGFTPAVVCIALGVAGVAWIGLATPLASRYSQISEDGGIRDSRLGHWQDGLRAGSQFLLTGSGLGTYSSIYLTVEENTNPHWFRHAHNQYIEALVDGGIPGLLLLLAAIALIGKSCWHLSTQREVGVHAWFGVAAVFLLVSQAAHGLTDFGLYLPANMMLCAVMCGAAAGTAAATSNSKLLRMPRLISRPILWNCALMAGVLFAMNHFRSSHAAKTIGVSQNLSANRTVKRPNVEDIEPQIGVLKGISRSDSTNAELKYRIGRLMLAAYQAGAYQIVRENDGLGKTDSELWERASVEHLHAAIIQLPDSDKKQVLDDLRAEPLVQKYLLPAREYLLDSRRLNAFRPKTHVLLAMLAPLFGEPDLPHLDHAERLANTDVEASFECGVLHLRANRTTRAIESWRRCLVFSRDHAEQILSIGRTRLDDDTLINEIMPDDPVLMVRIAEQKVKINPNSDLARKLARRALQAESLRTGLLTEYFRGRAATLLGEETLAAQHYGNAVRSQPNQTEWRYSYANALSNAGRLKEAKAQLEWCLGLYPGNGKYKRLMKSVESRSQNSDL